MDTALNLVSLSRGELLDRAAFYAVLAMRLKLVEQSEADCPTMATDGVHMFFSAAFVRRITPRQLMGVVMHEALHCAMRHFIRRAWREPELWNVAADLAINPIILAAGFELPQGALFEQRFVGMSAETIYDVLAQERAQGKDTPQAQGDGACGEVLDAPTQADDGTPIDANELDGAWSDTVKQAIGVANRRALAGNDTAGLDTFKAQLGAAQIDWKYELARFTDFSSYRDNDWTRPNKRFAWQGVTLPSMVPQRPSCALFLIDKSGSMDCEALARVNAEMQSALDANAFDQLVVIYFDTRVVCVDEYHCGDTIQIRVTQGSGGTDFRDAFERMANDYPDASCCVVLTDGGTDHWGVEPSCAVLWALTLPEAWCVNVNPPFGEKLPLL